MGWCLHLLSCEHSPLYLQRKLKSLQGPQGPNLRGPLQPGCSPPRAPASCLFLHLLFLLLESLYISLPALLPASAQMSPARGAFAEAPLKMAPPTTSHSLNLQPCLVFLSSIFIPQLTVYLPSLAYLLSISLFQMLAPKGTGLNVARFVHSCIPSQ